jgi:hypothetical protein
LNLAVVLHIHHHDHHHLLLHLLHHLLLLQMIQAMTATKEKRIQLYILVILAPEVVMHQKAELLLQLAVPTVNRSWQEHLPVLKILAEVAEDLQLLAHPVVQN